ncbi:MAG: chemotaxis protein CheW [Rhizobiaceae bacterium]|nr:chemotaxis protein CheW [Rhizobiaceae bacterium]
MSAKAPGSELLSVRVGVQEFALDIMCVREIRGWMSSTPMPHSPPSVKGMINLRGVILSVIDLGEKLGLAPVEPSSSAVVVVVQLEERLLGLLVDAVCDIITVTADMVQPTPDVGHQESQDSVSGIIMIDGRIVSILCVPHCFPERTAPIAA